MHWLKKATHPLDLHLRAGGYEVYPLAKIFAEFPFLCSPESLVQKELLTDPRAASAINALYSLGCLEEPVFECDSLSLIRKILPKKDAHGEKLEPSGSRAFISSAKNKGWKFTCSGDPLFDEVSSRVKALQRFGFWSNTHT
jgi:hypothetical protein